MLKILLLEDEVMLQSAIEEYLSDMGHKVYSYTKSNDVIKSCKKEYYDILILDINVPGINGLKLYEELRKNTFQSKAIFISALIDIDTISEAFNLGADEYIKKPFHLKELGIRVQNIAKRIDDEKREHILLSQNYSYVKSSKELKYKDKIQLLTKKQQSIIVTLCSNINSIVSIEYLREFVWNSENVSNSTIRAEISRLRKLLKEDFIQNVKGIGYKIDRYQPSIENKEVL